MPVVKVMKGRQVVIPKGLFEKLHLEVGDYLEVDVDKEKLVFVPKTLVARDEWYWSDEGQRAIGEALKDIEEGRVKAFDNVEDLFEELERE